MIPKSYGSISITNKWKSIYTLVILCNIVKISSGYLMNGNGIIRNSVINISNLNNLCNNKYYKNKIRLKNTSNDINEDSILNEENKLSFEPLVESKRNYSSDDIVVLEGLNAVRKRPGMYIGNTGERGVHQLLYEVLDNSVDEYLAGFCNKITVTLMKDGSVEISDNGRGIPCDVSPKTGKSGLETVLTVLHSGGKFQDTLTNYTSGLNVDSKKGNDSNKGSKGKQKGETDEKKVYEYSSGLHGVGLSVVNALSEILTVDVYKGDKRYHIELSKGQITKPLSEEPINYNNDNTNNNEEDNKKENNGTNKRFGTTVRFLPDYEQIFKTHHQHIITENDTKNKKGGNNEFKNSCPGCTNGFVLDLIKNRAKELSYLNPGLFIKLVDQRVTNEKGPWEETYHNTGGTRSFLEELIKDKVPLYKPMDIITIKGSSQNVNVEVSFNWSVESYSAVIKAYANNVSTIAGTHIDGFKTSVTRCVNGLLKKYGYFKGNVKPLIGDFIREGLTAVLSVKLSGAEFDGQTKTKLGNTILKTVMEKIMNEQFTEILDDNKELLLAIHNKSQAAKRAFDAAKTAKELIRQKSSNLLSNISGKLTECSSSNVSSNELFIVEGESAAGNAKQARNRQFQAVLPLKGKILNIEKITDNNKVLENQQIQLLINTIGINVNPVTWRQKDSPENVGVLENYSLVTGNNPEITNMNKLRYGKIILLTDADVDGSHLKSLLLCLLYRLCPSLYTEGRVYVATPPLYRITNLRNKKYIYSWSQEHLLKIIQQINSNKNPEDIDDNNNKENKENNNIDNKNKENKNKEEKDIKEEEMNENKEIEVDLKSELTSLNNINLDNPERELEFTNRGEFDFNKKLSKQKKNYIIQRFKGLGEMMAKQLWETTMDPKTRILKRIVITHPYEISNIIKLLMGSDVQSRKQYIFNNSGSFKLEDLDI